ncbi:hypothetical protein [Parasediminibacterium sp. JCM 36343]|uniref:hypothetical protein n=1 Tax=Parasediminibacterium sp. JCM 36343 TaxID=3374279 RepID=UPI0039795B11
MRKYIIHTWLPVLVLFVFPFSLLAQVNTVTFGKNRLQFKKLRWKFYQTANFNVYVHQGGTELGKFAALVAEEELPSIETAVEYSLQKRTDIVVYNSYDDYKQSNIGLGNDWQSAGGLTTLVNNKMVLYFDGNHTHLKQQIRQGLAKVLNDNLMFGEDVGDFASNQALLDLPKWLTDGYVAYTAEPWNTTLDDELKEDILSGNYNKFYKYAFKKPLLAGHAFWFYIAEKYKPENVTYFLYLARIYKSLNNASLKICKKKFKEVLTGFMDYEEEKYNKDVSKRRNNPKGSVVVSEDVSKFDYYRFTVNPNPRNGSYAEVEFKKGLYKTKLIDGNYDETTLLHTGVRTRQGDINPNYPILAWDTKGRDLLVIYPEAGKIKMFVYDMVAGFKKNFQEFKYFDQVLDASYMLDPNTVVLSAVKNGHSDIYIYKIEEQQITQITNDIYDDLNPTFVSFPNRSGILFSSNRPGNNAPNKDTVLPSRYPFNIYMVDIFNNTPTKQVAQLTSMKHGNATNPMQYNVNHFTFVSDETGITNRWAGFFSTQRNGLDTLYYIGDELLRNPSPKEMDSALVAWQKQEPDSVSYFQVFKDSTYTFPITNYSNSIIETKVAGNNGQISETKRDGDNKNLYKLKINEDVLRSRNVQARPTEYMKSIIQSTKAAEGKATVYKKGQLVATDADTAKAKPKDFFQNEFADDKPDSSVTALMNQAKLANKNDVALAKTKMFNYRYHFNADYVQSGITNTVLVNRYQPYEGGYGPIVLNNGNSLNLNFQVGTSDLFEDVKFVGGVRLGFNNLNDKDFFFSFQNNKRMVDWGLTYYRSNSSVTFIRPNTYDEYPGGLYTNLYQVNFTLPFNEVKSLRATIGVRTDRAILKAVDQYSLQVPDGLSSFVLSRLEYVHDNTLNVAQNIWDGVRFKIYMDINTPFGNTPYKGKNTYNFGFDGRYYKPIYRNFIWAGRAAGDFSWGSQKIIYYLGGVDGWINPKFNSNNAPANDQAYAYQSLAVNMRGYTQNIANGNNAVVLNSEFRLPVFATFLDNPINNAFIRNFQLVQFIDLGTAWNGLYNGIHRPHQTFTTPATADNPTANPVSVTIDAGGLGPFAGGYGFGARSNLLGYFVKLDTAWPMKGIFRGQPVWYFSLGLDF